MKRIKKLIFIVALSIAAYLQIQVSKDTDLINLYNGVVFNGNITFYIRAFFLFACYSLYVYNEFETYIKEYGIILVTREKSRSRLLARLTERLLIFLVEIGSMKILCYMVLMIMINGKITVNNPLELVKMMFLYVLVVFLMMFIQMIAELYLSGNIAVCIPLTCFLIDLGISDYIERSNLPSEINLFMFPNLMMKNRLDVLINNKNHYFILIGGLMMIMMSLFLVIKRKFQKKDIL